MTALHRPVLLAGAALIAVAVMAILWLAGLGASGHVAPVPAFFGAVVLHALLAFAIIEVDGRVGHRHEPWAYRLGFATSLGIALVLTATLAAGSQASPDYMAAAFLGAFAGSLEATRRDMGLWEDNFPPPPEVAERVRRRHEARMGPLPSVPFGKRAFDLMLGSTASLAALPVITVIALAVWLEDPGPLFFVKNSVGRGGRSFRQWKIRTMVRSAEAETGPVLASESDERVLWTGRWLRKTALDELPQLLNILQGSMSFVGPRPQRTILVDTYLDRLPEYADRHAVAPGIAGLAQVAGHYYLTPRQKLRYDRLYVSHSGLAFDLQLVAIAFATVFWLRWRPGWSGRLPRSWLHRRRPAMPSQGR